MYPLLQPEWVGVRGRGKGGDALMADGQPLVAVLLHCQHYFHSARHKG